MDILNKYGIVNLRPPQKKVLDLGLFDHNFIISIPTGAGKTLIGELAILNQIENGKKGAFLVPYKAIASEKYEEFKEKYEKFGIKIGLSIGDFDELDDITNFDIIVSTYEKFDSLIKHDSNILSDFGVFVIDEIHMIGNNERGATLESLLIELKSKKIQIVGLSATIGNPEELANWLNSKLFIDNWRPVPLKKGYLLNNEELILEDHGKKGNLIGFIEKCEYPVILFCSTKRSAVSYSKKFDFGNTSEREEYAKMILNVLNKPTKMCIELAECIRKGTAFHHAGLTYEHRKIVEKAFKEKVIKLICATSTIGAGINFPSRYVIVKDIKRFNNGRMEYIPSIEINQFLGRAGRPGLDPVGYGIICCNEGDIEQVKYYLSGKIEKIYSKFSNEVILRKQILGWIYNNNVYDWDSLKNKILSSFYAYQYNNLYELSFRIQSIIRYLEENGFIIGFKLTKLGVVSVLNYVDPKSIVDFLEVIKNKNLSELVLLFSICRATEVRNLVYVNRLEEEKLYSYMFNYNLSEFYDSLSSMKLALILYEWINGMKEDQINEKYGIEPGILRYIIENVRWILHCFISVMRVLNINEKNLYDLNYKLLYGIDDKFLDLVKLKYVGRKRAMILFENGIKNREDLIKNKDKVISLLGPKITEKIFNELKLKE